MYQLLLKHQLLPLLHLHPQASNLSWEVGPTNGVRSTLISNQVGAKANGGCRFVVLHHEEASISLCPYLIDEINVDLTPFVSNASLECWASTHKACSYVQRFY
jgi:hypothetical protein